MNFEFVTATRIVFGPGAVSEAGPLASQLGREALVVTGRTTERAAGLLRSLLAHGVGVTRFPVAGEPDTLTVEAGVAEARKFGCDLVISFGGGSVLDAGKAIAAMLANEGELADYLEIVGHGKALSKPSVPFVAIPTTAGTGSEVTRNAVLASPEHHVKVSLRSPLMLARVALVDPELTRDLPPALTAATGLDALTQLIEPYLCTRSNPLIDALCLDGIRRAARALPAAFADGHNAAAREDMALASLFGGLALANAGLGAVHGFAGPIGGLFPAAHGAVCAALLPHVMAANLQAFRDRGREGDIAERFQTIARALTGDADAEPEAAVEYLGQLVAALRIPPLSAYGIAAGHIPELVDKAARASSMKANPVRLNLEELSRILERAL